MAWKNREGGDKNHANGVHFGQNARTKAIKTFVKDKLRPDLKRFLGGADLFSPDLLAQSAAAHDGALAVLERMHAMPVHDAAERARLYRDELVGSAPWCALKDAMDLWCACWCWPSDDIEHAPLPSTFTDPPATTRAVARRVAAEMRFFHWELQFPDVFRQAGSGFDAMLGNPPWETLQPTSMEFFSNVDPLYRSYGKQEAIARQAEYFADVNVERAWLDYSSKFANDVNWMKHTASPFGDPQASDKGKDRFTFGRGQENEELHAGWREARDRSSRFGETEHPFRHRGGGKAYTYKLFLETAHALLRPPTSASRAADGECASGQNPADDPRGGRLGFLVPSGLYSDHGAGDLRRLFLERCRWEWLFGVENRDKVFPIHGSYKFNPVIIEKGGTTEAIRTVFMRRNPDDWERAEELATPYTRAQVQRFSPKSRALLEIQSQRDLEILEKIYANSVLLGDDGPDSWRVQYAQGDFNMTSDSKLFPPRPQWEAKGYRPDEYSRWLLGEWQPIEELWKEMGVDPSRPEPAAIELDGWLFDTTAGSERREAEARFVRGHWLKPGDLTRTDWRSRCARPPYDGLPVSRAALPPSVVLSRDGDAWMQGAELRGVALPLYQGIMIQPFLPSSRGWLSGTGLRAKWDYCDLGNLLWNPQYLMAEEHADPGHEGLSRLKIGYREVARNTDARSFIGAVLPSFPAGHKVPILHIGTRALDSIASAIAVFNSFVFDWVVRQRLGAAALAWYVLAEATLPRASQIPVLSPFIEKLNLFPGPFAAANTLRREDLDQALHPGERLRLRTMADAVACGAFGLDAHDFRHVLRDCDHPVSNLRAASGQFAALDPRGFWRVDRDKEPELPSHRPDARRLPRSPGEDRRGGRRPRARHGGVPHPERRRRLDAAGDPASHRLRPRPRRACP